MDSSYYVYSYSNPVTDEVFYLGKGKKERAFSHWRKLLQCKIKNLDFHQTVKKVGNEKKTEVLLKLFNLGLEPAISFVKEGLTEDEALLLEESLIQRHKDTVTNVSSGGIDPLVQSKRELGESFRALISQGARRYYDSSAGSLRRQFQADLMSERWRNMDPETRANWRDSKSTKMKNKRASKSEEEMQAWMRGVSEGNKLFWEKLSPEEKKRRQDRLSELAAQGKTPLRRAEAALRGIAIRHGNKIKWISSKFNVPLVTVLREYSKVTLSPEILELLNEDYYTKVLGMKIRDSFTFADFENATGITKRQPNFKAWKKLLSIQWEKIND